ncbi:hypothetical protein BC629DRAFT_70658 [Irpex lacteus]|nr:hypothetical protein BC629DRAFT_70658 [Irpex lacteus]
METGECQFEVWEWTDAGTVQRLVTPPAHTIVAEEEATPHPRYEAVTPSHCPIDPQTEETRPHCSFIKYAGQPGFDERYYLRHFYSIGWQRQPWRDPDHRIIAWTTIQRLVALPGAPAPSIPIYIDDIDDSHIFNQYGSISKLENDTSTVLDILFKMQQRDVLSWPGNASSEVNLRAHESVWRDFSRSCDQGKMNALASEFCPNLDCLQMACFTHLQEGTYTNEEVLEKVTQQPCGDACFLKLDSEEVYGSIDWDAEPEVETLDAMLKLAPNTLPCSLSTLFPQTDCYKIFARRGQVVQGYEVLQSKQQKPGLFVDDVQINDVSNLPCLCDVSTRAHAGRSLYRLAFATKEICIAAGTASAAIDAYAGTEDVSALAARICAAKQICTNEDNKGKAAKKAQGKCDNFTFQRDCRVQLIVQAGDHGLGTFAGQNIPKGSFLGCYIGEMYWNNEDYHRSLEYNYNGLNYMFRHNFDQALDAQHVGTKRGSSTTLLERRQTLPPIKIGFTAMKSIKKGDELFFDYGEDYWRRVGHAPHT